MLMYTTLCSVNQRLQNVWSLFFVVQRMILMELVQSIEEHIISYEPFVLIFYHVKVRDPLSVTNVLSLYICPKTVEYCDSRMPFVWKNWWLIVVDTKLSINLILFYSILTIGEMLCGLQWSANNRCKDGLSKKFSIPLFFHERWTI